VAITNTLPLKATTVTA